MMLLCTVVLHVMSHLSPVVAVWVVILSPLLIMLMGNVDLPRLRYERLPTSKSAIFELFTGRYPAPQFCEVSWDWKEPQCVGKTMSFSVRVSHIERHSVKCSVQCSVSLSP